MFFKRNWALVFDEVVIMNVDDTTYKRIFYTHRSVNADVFNYTNLGKNIYLKTKK